MSNKNNGFCSPRTPNTATESDGSHSVSLCFGAFLERLSFDLFPCPCSLGGFYDFIFLLIHIVLMAGPAPPFLQFLWRCLSVQFLIWSSAYFSVAWCEVLARHLARRWHIRQFGNVYKRAHIGTGGV